MISNGQCSLGVIFYYMYYVSASFLNVTLVSGTIRTFGILYAELLDVHDNGAGNTAFMGSLLLFVMAVAGKYYYNQSMNNLIVYGYMKWLI